MGFTNIEVFNNPRPHSSIKGFFIITVVMINLNRLIVALSEFTPKKENSKSDKMTFYEERQRVGN
jgi:hypothetical protein